MTISTILILLGILFFVFLLNQFLNKKEIEVKEKDNKQYYKSRENFFTKSEHIFFKELEKQNDGKYHIFSKVRLEDIVQVTPDLDYKTKRIKRNSIKSRHIDFALVDKETNKIILAIELDGSSHNSKRQIRSDKKKNEILKSAGIKLSRIKVGQNFTNEIKKMI